MAEFSELEILRTLETFFRQEKMFALRILCEWDSNEMKIPPSQRSKRRHFETVIPKYTFQEKRFV